MSLILMEGPDGAGKTVTAKAVFADYHYQHNGPPENAERVVEWQLLSLLPDVTVAPAPARWVVDRSWPSEQAYHKHAGRRDAFTETIVREVFEPYMLRNRGVVVLCLPPYAVARGSWAARAAKGQELLTDEAQFADTYAFYARWPLTTNLPHVVFDYTKHSHADLRAWVDRVHRGER
jgi:hypothetical protein